MAVFVARRLMEEVRRLCPDSLPLVFIFVDYLYIKAFDTVLWEALWAILALDRMPPAFILLPLVDCMRAHRQHCGLRMAPPHHSPFTTGCGKVVSWAPYLFIIVVDHVMRRACARFTALKGFEPGLDILNEREHGGVSTGYRLADLIYICGRHHPHRAPRALSDLAGLSGPAWRRGRCMGLEIRVKTEAMVIGASSSPPLPRLLARRDGGPVNTVTGRFKLLGSMLPDTADDMDIRIGLAWARLRSLSTYWRSKDLGEHCKRMLFKVLVLTELTYGAEAWTLTDTMAAVSSTARFTGCSDRS
eukprot:jgi/Mesvir1/27543/Mv26393-RA.1